MSRPTGRPPIEIDKESLKEAYKKSGSTRGAAKMLGVSDRTIRRKMTEFGLARKQQIWVMPEW